MTGTDIELRPFAEEDLRFLDRLATDRSLSDPFEWFGFRSPRAYRRRWDEDGFLDGDPRYLVVGEVGGPGIGWVMWRKDRFAQQHDVFEIGALLAPEHRGRGAGTAAQGLLVDYLFATTTAHRLWAGTESENLPEQRSLEKCGFRREGVLREAVFRDGRWRDSVVYGLLRKEVRRGAH